MSAGKKTDNHNLAAKLVLRRYFMDRYHRDDPPKVMDCCEGSGVIWRVLRREYNVARYWGIDLKPEPGRLTLDSERVLSQPGWTEDVIDVDTYGSPWGHWCGMLPHVQKPVTVFLTFGVVRARGGSQLSKEEIEVRYQQNSTRNKEKNEPEKTDKFKAFAGNLSRGPSSKERTETHA